MKQFKSLGICLLLLGAFHATAQTEAVPVFKGAVKSGREKIYNDIIKFGINKNLSLPLADSTEENWESAFDDLELINYKEPWVNDKIRMAFDGIENRSIDFQRSLLEMLYALNNKGFIAPVNKLLQQTANAKIFAMCGEYLILCKAVTPQVLAIVKSKSQKMLSDNDEKINTIIACFMTSLSHAQSKRNTALPVKDCLDKKYLRNNVVLYSIQRKNRNYPGIVIVKDGNGNFVRDDNGNIFSVPQLARSIANLPSYLTNGNTPQGIFRMHGFEVSRSQALGPTQNIQLTMPYETSVQHFLNDSSIADTGWTIERYKELLPGSWKKNFSAYETYYASKAGRTEIIAHGTTVDPDFYKGQPYYPHTPTEGCLCTKEIWSAVDGKRTESNQQKLVDAVKKAGGPDGYLIVVEIDDQQKPVSLNEILPYLKASK